jgi:cyclase
MSNIRLIPRLDIKGKNLIKGIHLEGLRVIGDPNEFAQAYYHSGADELIYMDVVATLYGRNNLSDIIKRTAENVFIPITVGGGVRSVDDVKHLLRCGADKIAVNTAATIRPELITEISRQFGSQCMVLSIEAKQQSDGQWEVMTNNGRERTHMNVVDWAKQAENYGAGEILLTSVDREGTKKGLDLSLIEAVSSTVNIPVIASGGVSNSADVIDGVKISGANAIAMADILHYKLSSIQAIRKNVFDANIHVRKL